MLLKQKDAELFFKLHRSLMHFVNQRLQAIPDKHANPIGFSLLPAQARVKVRGAFLKCPDLLQTFVNENPAHLSNDEKEIVKSWQYLIQGKFIIMHELKKYTLFLTADQRTIAYGVLALTQPFEELIGPHRPILCEAVLLPFRDVIVYDSLLSTYNISFGSGILRSCNESLREAKARYGIVTSLPMSTQPLPLKAVKAKPAPKPPSREKKDQTVQIIIDLLDQFCKDHLDEEYAKLCRKMAGKLGRKRPSPLERGSLNAWASGIVRTLGRINFLHDKSQTPYMRTTDIDHYFGISPSNGAAKMAEICSVLKVDVMDFKWTLPCLLEQNPMVWMIQVDGFMVDTRDAPRAVQEMAFRKGLIPYIPADRRQGE